MTHATWAGLTLDRPIVMGILNVTPDSFSDGGLHANTAAAIAGALRLIEEGADIIDVGGESTRPNARVLTPVEEQARILPVIEALASAGHRISVDTRNAATMAAALETGAMIVNDVSGLTHDPDAPALVASRACPVVLMHMRGSPATMTRLTQYDDVVDDVVAELRAVRDRAERAGIDRSRIVLDPGIGFAKTAGQSARLLRDLGAFAALDCPLLVGASRKSFIGRLADAGDPAARLPGSLAAALWAVGQGARIVRVHDVAETVQALSIWRAISLGLP